MRAAQECHSDTLPPVCAPLLCSDCCETDTFLPHGRQRDTRVPKGAIAAAAGPSSPAGSGGCAPGPARPRGGAVPPQLRPRTSVCAGERLRQPRAGGLEQRITHRFHRQLSVCSHQGRDAALVTSGRTQRVSCTPCATAGASAYPRGNGGLSRMHSSPPAASLLSGIMWLQSEGFSWETSLLNFKSCFPGAQMLFTGLKSEAKLSSSTRGSFNKPHQLPQHLHVLPTPLPSALVSLLQALCRDRKESGGALSHRRNVSPAGCR